jgi:endogenous inhibitor of DNA gyrase (YacG/DUF329 family)
VRCPICAAEVVQVEGAWPATFPFCSERCKLLDLAKWLGEGYRIPGSPQEDDAE